MAPELIKCPHCGFRFRTDIGERVKAGETNVVRSIFNFWKKEPVHPRSIDIICPECKKTFEHKVV